MSCASVVFTTDIIDEIALEGLDGITFQGLWLRLDKRPGFVYNFDGFIDDDVKELIWQTIRTFGDIKVYQLPEARLDLVIYNRYEHVDPELGFVMEQPSHIPDLYPLYKVRNAQTGEMGSCLHYYKRVDISSKARFMDLTLLEETYGKNKVVIVASQELREKALGIRDRVDPFSPITLAQYCILERIGRTRTMGDVTQGKHGMTQIGDPKSLFYHRKKLQKLGLLTKQTHLQKGIKGSSQTGSLLHLTRFYVERKSKFLLLIEECIRKLEPEPQRTLPQLKLKEILAIPETTSRKLFKNPEFLKYIEFVSLPFTDVYTTSPKKVSHYKSGKEKLIRCARLLPGVTIRDGRVVKISQNAEAIENQDERGEPEDDEEDDDVESGLIEVTKMPLKRTLLYEAFKFASECGSCGVTQRDIARRLGQPRLDSRSICRHLERIGAVIPLMRDIGKQRITHYVCSHLMNTSQLSQELLREKHRLLQLTSASGPCDVSTASNREVFPVVSECQHFSSSNSIMQQIVENSSENFSSEVPDCATKETEDLSSSGITAEATIELDSTATIIPVNLAETALSSQFNTLSEKDCTASTPLIMENCDIGALPQESVCISTRAASTIDFSAQQHFELNSDPEIYLTSPTLLDELPEHSTGVNIKTEDSIGPQLSVNCPQLAEDPTSSLTCSSFSGVFESNAENVAQHFDHCDAGLDCICPGMSEIQDFSKSLNMSATDKSPDPLDCEELSNITHDIIEDRDFMLVGPRVQSLLDASTSGRNRSVPQFTARLLRRANLILEMVREHRVISDVFKVQKCILEAEHGEEHKVDKKSVRRLLERLREGGHIKVLKVRLNVKDGDKSISMVVAPDVKTDDPCLKRIIEQTKMKFSAPPLRKDTKDRISPFSDGIVAGPFDHSSDKDKTRDAVSSGSSLAVDCKMPSDGKGSTGSILCPKMVRLQVLHRLLFYVTYGYSGDPNLDQDVAWKKLCQENPKLCVGPRDSNLPRIYAPEFSWRMFISPRQEHVADLPGWCFILDVLMNLPLLLLLRIIKYDMTRELRMWLTHPWKKFVPVKLLPTSIRSVLLDSRRYVHNFMELINRLCYMGLAQLGRQISKERDHRYVYINRNATLLDTTLSGPGYHQVSPDRQYPATSYHFTDCSCVNQYWYDLMNICLRTPLGGHRGLQGQAITMVLLNHKEQMIATLAVKQFDEALAFDTGRTPGDGKGAAGLDSALFAHLKRNWSKPLHYGHTDAHVFPTMLFRGQDRADAKFSRIKSSGGLLYHSYLLGTTYQRTQSSSIVNKPPGLRKLFHYKTRKGDEKQEETHVALSTKDEKSSWKAVHNKAVKLRRGSEMSRSRRLVHRRFKARNKTTKKPYYDEEDRAALRKMNKLRVDWSATEDSLLLLCKVASCYLLPSSPRPRMLPFTLVRNILHKRFPESQNKTGRACQRRINYIMKDPTTADSVSVYVEEVRQDPYIQEHFVPPRIPQNRENLDSVYGTIFLELVDYLVNKFKSSSNRNSLEIPNSYELFARGYEVIPAKSIKPVLIYENPTSVDEIQFNVIQTLLYSSLCCRADRESYAYQLYQAYNQFPQQLLYNALLALRGTQMISYKKCYNRSSSNQPCLPLSASPFQLSMSYVHKFVTKYQYDLYQQCWSFLTRLKDSYINAYLSGKRPEDFVKEPECSVSLMRDGINDGGCVAALIEQTTMRRVIMHTVLPETIIIVDANRTLTSKLPHAKNSIQRRVKDLVEVSGKKQDFSAVPFYNEYKRQIDDQADELARRSSDKRLLEADDDETNDSCQSNAKKLCLAGHQQQVSNSSSISTEVLENCVVSDSKMSAYQPAQQTSLKRPLGSPSGVYFSVSESSDKKQCLGEGSIAATCTDLSESLNELGLDNSMDIDPNISAPDTDCDTETEQSECASSVTENCRKPEFKSSSSSRLAVFMKDQRTMSLLDDQDMGQDCPALLQHMQDNWLLAACDVSCQYTLPPSAALPPIPPTLNSRSPIRADANGPNSANDGSPNRAQVDTDRPYKADAESPNGAHCDAGTTIQTASETEADFNEQGICQDGATAVISEMHTKQNVKDSNSKVHLQKCSNLSDKSSDTGQTQKLDLKDRKSKSRSHQRQKRPVEAKLVNQLTQLLCPADTKHQAKQLESFARGEVDMSVRLEDVLEQWREAGYSEESLSTARDVYAFIENRGAIGATRSDIKCWRTTFGGGDCMTVVEELVEEGLLVREGVECHVWLTLANAYHWFVHTQHLSRQQRLGLRLQGVYCMNVENLAKDSSSAAAALNSEQPTPYSLGVKENNEPVSGNKSASDCTDAPSSQQTLEDTGTEGTVLVAGTIAVTEVNQRTNSVSGSEQEATIKKESSTSHRPRRSQRIPTEGESVPGRVRSKEAVNSRSYRKDVERSRSMELLANERQRSERHENVSLALRPWMRIYGCVNRRVLDRMLGSVLFIVLEQPGISGVRVAAQLAPALIPTHVYDLLHLLQRLQCVQVFVMAPSKPFLCSTVFDAYEEELVKEIANAEAEEDEKCYVPAQDCISRLSVFIGDRKYQHDFLSDRR